MDVLPFLTEQSESTHDLPVSRQAMGVRQNVYSTKVQFISNDYKNISGSALSA